MEANTSQPVVTFDMLISYLKQEEYVKIPPNTSEDLVNVSTIEFHDPYLVEPDLSAEVHMSETSSVLSGYLSKAVTLTCGILGVYTLLPVSDPGRGTRLYHEFHRVLALLEKQKGRRENSRDPIFHAKYFSCGQNTISCSLTSS